MVNTIHLPTYLSTFPIQYNPTLPSIQPTQVPRHKLGRKRVRKEGFILNLEYDPSNIISTEYSK